MTAVICELVELLLVNEAQSLIDQYVSVLGLVTSLVLNDLLHGRVVCVLSDLSFPVLVFTAKRLFWNQAWVEMLHKSIVELVPLAFSTLRLFSILDEGIIVAGVGGAIVDDDTLQLVLEVLIGDCSVQQDSLILIKVLHRKILLTHFFQ